MENHVREKFGSVRAAAATMGVAPSRMQQACLHGKVARDLFDCLETWDCPVEGLEVVDGPAHPGLRRGPYASEADMERRAEEIFAKHATGDDDRNRVVIVTSYLDRALQCSRY